MNKDRTYQCQTNGINNRQDASRSIRGASLWLQFQSQGTQELQREDSFIQAIENQWIVNHQRPEAMTDQRIQNLDSVETVCNTHKSAYESDTGNAYTAQAQFFVDFLDEIQAVKLGLQRQNNDSCRAYYQQGIRWLKERYQAYRNNTLDVYKKGNLSFRLRVQVIMREMEKNSIHRFPDFLLEG